MATARRKSQCVGQRESQQSVPGLDRLQASASKTAVAIWKKAVAALPPNAEPKDPEAILVAFINAFNKLDAKTVSIP
jgi:hypothetical protein